VAKPPFQIKKAVFQAGGPIKKNENPRRLKKTSAAKRIALPQKESDRR